MSLNHKPVVKLPVDHLDKVWPKDLVGKKLACLLHPASVRSDFKHTLESVLQFNGELFELSALFGPQHGIYGHTQDNMIEWEGYTDPQLNIPVYSLYGEHREPTVDMYKHFDVIMIDLQDVGARYYTFIWTMYLCMKTAEKTGKTVVVCDRPNPITNRVEGPILDSDYFSFVGLHNIPIRHGDTIGEMALRIQKEVFPNVDLRILAMENHNPEAWFDETGLPWVLPSPNMPTLDTAIVYPGMCLFEATNVSEGRGTTKPFEIFGAPFIDGEKFCEYMNSKNKEGVLYRPVWFQPTFHKGAGEICQGAQIHVLDREVYKPIDGTLDALTYLFKTYPKEFKWRTEPYEYVYDKLAIDILLGSKELRKELIEDRDL